MIPQQKISGGDSGLAGREEMERAAVSEMAGGRGEWNHKGISLHFLGGRAEAVICVYHLRTSTLFSLRVTFVQAS